MRSNPWVNWTFFFYEINSTVEFPSGVTAAGTSGVTATGTSGVTAAGTTAVITHQMWQDIQREVWAYSNVNLIRCITDVFLDI